MNRLDRYIELEGSSNFRDIGGYQTQDGRRLRWGLVYRSGSMHRFSNSAWRWISEHGIRAVCDLRSVEERELAPTRWSGPADTRHIGSDYAASFLFQHVIESKDVSQNAIPEAVYVTLPRLLAPSFRAMFDALLTGQTPLVVHCTAGQDRTGLAVGLLLHVLGVQRDTIVEDYLLSTRYRRMENEIQASDILAASPQNAFARFYAPILERRGPSALQPRELIDRSGRALLLRAFADIEAEWGSLDRYLDDTLNLSPADVALLKSIALVD
jgi:protein-tyrosine phosphatase